MGTCDLRARRCLLGDLCSVILYCSITLGWAGRVLRNG